MISQVYVGAKGIVVIYFICQLQWREWCTRAMGNRSVKESKKFLPYFIMIMIIIFKRYILYVSFRNQQAIDEAP